MYKLTISGEPTAKQRPRMGNGFTYTPTKTVNYETLVKELFISNYPNGSLLEGPLRMRVVAYFTIPESKSKKVKEEMRNGIIRPTKKPDWDNIGKIISDALNTIAYKDDSQIVESSIQKFYSDNPRVEVYINQMTN